MRTIEVVVDTQGNARVETRGFAGAGCREASKAFERALGLVSSETLTAEFYQANETRQGLKQQG